MTIFIAPIGTDTEHIKTWLKEESRNLSTLWLIHSKKGNNDFIKIAKKLSSDLSKSYSNIEIKLKAISDAFTIDPTMDAIYEVITQEELEDVMVNRQDFIINITGGTNIMAAAAMNAATFNQTRAQYVLQPQPKDHGQSVHASMLILLVICFILDMYDYLKEHVKWVQH